jgi:hypothetical protein
MHISAERGEALNRRLAFDGTATNTTAGKWKTMYQMDETGIAAPEPRCSLCCMSDIGHPDI